MPKSTTLAAIDNQIRGWRWVVDELNRARRHMEQERERLYGPERGE